MKNVEISVKSRNLEEESDSDVSSSTENENDVDTMSTIETDMNETNDEGKSLMFREKTIAIKL